MKRTFNLFKKTKLLLLSLTSAFTLMSCSGNNNYKSYDFKYWNDCQSLIEITDYVKDVTNPNSENFIPKNDRIVTFDMDGTLFGERSPIYIEWLFYKEYFDNSFEGDKDHQITYETNGTYRTISLRETYNEIDEFINGSENPNLEMDEAHCGAYLFSNITIQNYINKVESFLNKDAYSFNNLKFKDMFYLPMKEIVSYLQLNDFTTYICSGTDRFMCRKIACEALNIPSNQVIGMDVSLYMNENQEPVRGDKLIYKNVKTVKPELISQEIGKKPVLSFGNSSGDIEMHNFVIKGNSYKSKAFMIVADDQVRERGYTPEQIEKRTQNWGEFSLISMKNNWKTIYGYDVTLHNAE